MSDDAACRGFDQMAWKFHVVSCYMEGEVMTLSQFDALQTEYRVWLINGFSVEVTT